MDEIKERGLTDTAKYRSRLDAFISVLRNQATPPQQIIWITPPDASHYSVAVKRAVEAVINDEAKRNGFEAIDSSLMTKYIAGETGGDGIHYNEEKAKDWAANVIVELDRILF